MDRLTDVWGGRYQVSSIRHQVSEVRDTRKVTHHLAEGVKRSLNIDFIDRWKERLDTYWHADIYWQVNRRDTETHTRR